MEPQLGSLLTEAYCDHHKHQRYEERGSMPPPATPPCNRHVARCPSLPSTY